MKKKKEAENVKGNLKWKESREKPWDILDVKTTSQSLYSPL